MGQDSTHRPDIIRTTLAAPQDLSADLATQAKKRKSRRAPRRRSTSAPSPRRPILAHGLRCPTRECPTKRPTARSCSPPSPHHPPRVDLSISSPHDGRHGNMVKRGRGATTVTRGAAAQLCEHVDPRRGLRSTSPPLPGRVIFANRMRQALRAWCRGRAAVRSPRDWEVTHDGVEGGN